MLAVHSDHPAQPPASAQGKVTREDLNAAIEKGDWAQVGATAALLADYNSSDQSMSESEHGPANTGGATGSFFSESSDSNNRAAELDRMVETGDWEGVVLAAAQFEGDDSTHHSSNSMSGKSSTTMEKEELRAEVERLVRRVVPDEIDNIDEMMLQFEGREEELIETLRTMQERSVAQRARAAVQKTAKLEARAQALSNRPSTGSVSSSSEPSYYAGSANSSVSDYAASSPGNGDSSSIDSSSVSDLGMTSGDELSSSRKTTQSSLELAIERGDWRAVGEAAAMMGEGASAAIIPDEGGSSLSSSLSESQDKQERVHHLDALIAKGDWAGIVAAAGKYQALDDQTGAPTEEEREALAQASLWQEIANQSKIDSATSAQGAVDAGKNKLILLNSDLIVDY